MKFGNPWLLSATLTISIAFLAADLHAKDTLQIDKAVLGAKDAWRDVTMFLEDQIDEGVLSVSITQPFSSIGGDPAPGKGKNLIIDYKLNGQQRRLWLEEQYPIAFQVNLPSQDAEPPGANPQVAALLENAASSANLRAQVITGHGSALIYAVAVISVAALACAGLALFQLRQIRRALKPPSTTG